ncbi:hypothetical protein DY000_02006523 [Brassica cretica]|uniref:Uncharacterized protein n=1 Tax=Brassica cretica TaxID=69181 RepID=A0ABQ7CF76_BRACR|nr:hypothetical protein DY000_02006523 [Brassica cretica]
MAFQVHAQQYQKQQENSTAILIRSRKLGAFNPQRNTFLIDQQQHLFVVGVKIGYDEINIVRGIQLSRSSSCTKSSSANGRAGSSTDSSRPFAELDRTRIQLGRSPSWSSPVRRTAKLDRPESIFASSS